VYEPRGLPLKPMTSNQDALCQVDPYYIVSRVRIYWRFTQSLAMKASLVDAVQNHHDHSSVLLAERFSPKTYAMYLPSIPILCTLDNWREGLYMYPLA
jgi:hypothetical protein